MPDQGGPFTYPPLPPDADAIRILILSAGDFNDPLECTLTSTAFGEKSAYVALSYTWGFPYPDMSEMHVSPDVAGSTAPLRGISTQNTPYISNTALLRLNNQLFPVGPNLLLALLHLRSPKYTLPLWVDAICINQADTEERNRQVSLMSYIYTRAIKVVAWLGTQRYKNMAGLFRIMSLQWKAGHTRHLGATVAEGGGTRCSPQPTKGTLVRISESTYWTRLWIVQEVCLPRLLLLAYGSDIWTFETFHQFSFQSTVQQSLPQPVLKNIGLMQRLFETRAKRYTDMMTLENLIEGFCSNGCSELKDKVYGLLGCANDIRPSVDRDIGTVKRLQLHDAFSSPQEHPPRSRRTVGSLKIDYSCSFYELWASVIESMISQLASIEDATSALVSCGAQGKTVDDIMREQRRINIVRVAGIVQNALGQNIETETGSFNDDAVGYTDTHPIFNHYDEMMKLTVPRVRRTRP